MPRAIDVHLLPALAKPPYSQADPCAARAVVMIDILRASTTITQALAHGARQVLPCLEVDEARRMAAAFPFGMALTGGERGGLLIPGFDLGNSPREYQPAVVRDKTIVFTTTNGTRALEACAAGREVLIGAFVNASAVLAVLRQHEAVHLMCAGTGGEVTREDALFAGYIAAELVRSAGANADIAQNDSCRLAVAAWQIAFGDQPPTPRRLEHELRATQGGRNLATVGLAHDLSDVAALDRFSIVPIWNPRSRAIGIRAAS